MKFFKASLVVVALLALIAANDTLCAARQGRHRAPKNKIVASPQANVHVAKNMQSWFYVARDADDKPVFLMRMPEYFTPVLSDDNGARVNIAEGTEGSFEVAPSEDQNRITRPDGKAKVGGTYDLKLVKGKPVLTERGEWDAGAAEPEEDWNAEKGSQFTIVKFVDLKELEAAPSDMKYTSGARIKPIGNYKETFVQLAATNKEEQVSCIQVTDKGPWFNVELNQSGTIDEGPYTMTDEEHKE